MNAREKLNLKHSLTIAGFWDDEESDPVIDEKATGALLLKIEKRLAGGAYLFFHQPLPRPTNAKCGSTGPR